MPIGNLEPLKRPLNWINKASSVIYFLLKALIQLLTLSSTDAFELLQRSPNLTTKYLWDKVISNTDPKVHNSRMSFVAALFHEGYLIP
jgi:hypothetical protein